MASIASRNDHKHRNFMLATKKCKKSVFNGSDVGRVLEGKKDS